MYDNITINENVRLSESVIWDLQRQFFIDEGVNAWETQVPYYATSNLYIVDCYANMSIRYIEDYVKNNDYDPAKPFYLFELGTGHGQFSFYFLKRIFELQQQLGMQAVKICYVMTDFTDSNIKYWEKHGNFKSFLEKGQLDFALYNFETDQSMHLIHANQTLDCNTVKNPIVMYGNYLFDSGTQDVFAVENKQISAGHPIIETPPHNVKDNRPLRLSDIHLYFEHTPIDENRYYQDQNINKVLIDYKKNIQHSSFLMPIGGFRCIANLQHLSNGRMMMICSDKAYTCYEELDNNSDPGLSFHGNCCSMMVNLHALGKYIENLGGKALHQDIRYNLKTSVYLLDKNTEKLHETHTAFEKFINGFGPSDFFNFHKHLKARNYELDFETILSHMYFCRWDPYIFSLFIDRITATAPHAEQIKIDALLEGVKKIEANIYHMPGCQDTYFNIALLHHALDDFEKALIYYQKSDAVRQGENMGMYNLAMCYYSLAQYDKALPLFEGLLQQEPESEEIQYWIKQTKAAISGEEPEEFDQYLQNF